LFDSRDDPEFDTTPSCGARGILRALAESGQLDLREDS